MIPQNPTKCTISILKHQKFSGEWHYSLPRSLRSPPHSSRLLRCLDSLPEGARPPVLEYWAPIFTGKFTSMYFWLAYSCNEFSLNPTKSALNGFFKQKKLQQRLWIEQFFFKFGLNPASWFWIICMFFQHITARVWHRWKLEIFFKMWIIVVRQTVIAQQRDKI